MITLKSKEDRITVYRYEFAHDKYGTIIVEDFWKDGHMGIEIYDDKKNNLTDNEELFDEIFQWLEEEGR